MANVFYRDFTPVANFKNAKRPNYSECLQYFKSFLSNFSIFSAEDLENLDKYWEFCVMKKNDGIVMPGEICSHIVFICKGAVKHFTGGPESPYIIEFATSCNFSTAVRSFLGQIKAVNGFVCAQDVYGLKISRYNYDQLIKERPAFEKLLHLINDKANENILIRLTAFQSMDAKGRYELMLSQYPDIYENYSMQDISNYLGIKAETLSRLKKEVKMQ